TEHWPIVITTLFDGMTDADCDAYIAEIHSKVITREEPIVCITDCSNLSRPPGAAQRKKLADWQKELVRQGHFYEIGTVTILNNPLVRGALTALHWLFPPRTPNPTVATWGEAY